MIFIKLEEYEKMKNEIFIQRQMDTEEFKKSYKLEQRINKAIKEVKELYEMAKEQDSDNVNLIDRLELILKILGGEDNESN